MKRILIVLMMALLLVGSADAQKKTRKKTSGKARTTATTKAKSKTSVRSALEPILPPQREVTEDMLRRAQRETDNLLSRYGGSRGNEAKTQYEKALNGDAREQYSMGLAWSTGSYGEKDEAEALRWYHLAAIQGHVDACENVAYDYFNGTGIKQNYFGVAKWYAKAKALGSSKADFYLGLAKSHLTQKEFQMAVEEAGLNAQSVSQDGKRAVDKVQKRRENNKKYEKFYGTWTSARGTTFTITSGPYLDLVGAGKFSGEWTSNGELYVSFGYPDELHLRYYNGYLYDRNGRKYWRIGD